jgi:hypothetical protein
MEMAPAIGHSNKIFTKNKLRYPFQVVVTASRRKKGTLKMKRKLLTGLIATVSAVACIGTACGAKNAPAVGDAAPTASGTPSGAPTGAKTVTINDPILNMTAFTLSIPANWIFQGAVIQGTGCVPGPFAVMRISSPDGLTGLKMLPRLDWVFSENPKAPALANSGCMDFKKEMPASEVLKYMVGVLQVEFVKDDPVPWLADQKKKIAAQNTPKTTFTIDTDMATVRYHINNIEIQEQLRVVVSCQSFHNGLAFNGMHFCSAAVLREWAPQGKWSADTFDPIAKTLAVDPEWSTKWQSVMNAKIGQQINAQAEAGRKMIQGAFDASNARMAAQQNAFNQAQDMRQKQHEDFDATIKRGTDMSMKQAAASANANHRAAGDWTDYSLDQQKRLDPNTGKITKDSSAYSYTWVNDQGKRIQTNDVNDNPNGNGTGNWTLQQNVH